MLEIKSLTWAVVPDITTTGEPCYLVKDLDLDGCMGQGKTKEEATANWLDAREEYIVSMIEDGMFPDGLILSP